LTLQQRAAIRDPNNPSSKLDFVNTTESRICGVSKTITNSTTQSQTLCEQGYAKEVEDTKLVQSNFRASTIMSPEQVDGDSSIDPQASNKEYCSGYQHGFADTNNN
jgi:hypothetical protein